ncbi:hypothetical protein B0H12DRAFT_1095334, partial [Mycena haematopus]
PCSGSLIVSQRSLDHGTSRKSGSAIGIVDVGRQRSRSLLSRPAIDDDETYLCIGTTYMGALFIFLQQCILDEFTYSLFNSLRTPVECG